MTFNHIKTWKNSQHDKQTTNDWLCKATVLSEMKLGNIKCLILKATELITLVKSHLLFSLSSCTQLKPTLRNLRNILRCFRPRSCCAEEVNLNFWFDSVSDFPMAELVWRG